uniref:Ig-like domain-containing protein n=1 Tax=Pygocentrus nattereri TaxID=42514 RepID=A0A3B4CUX6_PYGNA
MNRISLLISLCHTEGTDVFRKEGEPVTLKCSYDSTSSLVLLYWYRQHPNRALQFILYKAAPSSSAEHIPDSRFTSTTTSSSTELRVRELRLADTALYYCALQVGAQWQNNTINITCRPTL